MITIISSLFPVLFKKDPLDILLKTTEEIEEMKSKGIILSIGNNEYSKKLKKQKRANIKEGIAVKHGEIIVNGRFETREKALEWAKYNYNGYLENINIVEIIKNQEIKTI
jgi:hypothetical protein